MAEPVIYAGGAPYHCQLSMLAVSYTTTTF